MSAGARGPHREPRSCSASMEPLVRQRWPGPTLPLRTADPPAGGPRTRATTEQARCRPFVSELRAGFRLAAVRPRRRAGSPEVSGRGAGSLRGGQAVRVPLLDFWTGCSVRARMVVTSPLQDRPRRIIWLTAAAGQRRARRGKARHAARPTDPRSSRDPGGKALSGGGREASRRSGSGSGCWRRPYRSRSGSRGW